MSPRSLWPCVRTLGFVVLLSGASGCGWFAAGVAGTIYATEGHGPTGADLALLRQQSGPYGQPGRATIEGQIRLPVGNGLIVVPPATRVLLTPATTWMQAPVQQQVVGADRLPQRVDAGEIWWVAHTDAGGRFSFSALPAGDYFVLCPVAWTTASGKAATSIAWAQLTLAAGGDARLIVGRPGPGGT